jgi:microcystin-dependent protein
MEAFIGQILLVGFNFAPAGWAFCDGSLQAINENPTLFNLIGTTYGGDGQTTFALPDLRGRTPIGIGTGPGLSNYVLGQPGGAENVTITPATYPTHTHSLSGTSDSGNAQNPSGALLASGQNIYRAGPPVEVMNAAMVGMAPGNSLAHNNLQPFQVCNWIISLFGIYPSAS